MDTITNRKLKPHSDVSEKGVDNMNNKDTDTVKQEINEKLEDIEVTDGIVLDQHADDLNTENCVVKEEVECKTDGEFLYNEEEERIVSDYSSDDFSVETKFEDQPKRKRLKPQHNRPTNSDHPGDSDSDRDSDGVAAGSGKRPRRRSHAFTAEEEAGLAEWYAATPCLYNKKLTVYRDSHRKARIYKEKAEEMRCTETKLRNWMANMRTRYSKICEGRNVRSGDGAQDDSMILSERDQWIMTAFAFLKTHIVRCVARKSKSLPTSHPSQAATQAEPVSPEDPGPDTPEPAPGQRGEPLPQCTVSPSDDVVVSSRAQFTDRVLAEIMENQQKMIEGHEALVQMFDPKSLRARKVRTFLAYLAPMVEFFDEQDYNAWRDHVLSITHYYDEAKDTRPAAPPCQARSVPAPTPARAPPAPPQQGRQQPQLQQLFQMTPPQQ